MVTDYQHYEHSIILDYIPTALKIQMLLTSYKLRRIQSKCKLNYQLSS